MNIICLDNNYRGCKKPEEGPAWFLLSHSCLHRDQKPYYVPDWDKDFRMFPSVAIKIDRLGKGIPARFAGRYWSQWSFGLSARGMDTYRRLTREGLPAGAAMAFDYCAAIGPWREGSKEELAASTFAIEADDNVVAEWRYPDLILDADRSIEYISRFITLKTGDIIFLGFTPEGFALDRDFKINVKRSVSGAEDTISEPFMGLKIRTTFYNDNILSHISDISDEINS